MSYLRYVLMIAGIGKQWRVQTAHTVQRLRHFEYWPFWLFYVPAYFYGAMLALRARSITYFSATNPGMLFGGAFDMSKSASLAEVNDEYLPKTLLFPHGSTAGEIRYQMQISGLHFPIIAKPDIGERGAEVEVIHNAAELDVWLARQRYDSMIQEYVTYPVELGVLYYQKPNSSERGITSIVLKEFLSVTGNGQSNLLELIQNDNRAMLCFDYLCEKFVDQLDEVLTLGEQLFLEPIGNHSRGTTFLNGNDLINEQLVDVFAEIASTMDGFYYGRFDLKVSSIEDLYAGRNIRILEVNGVNSEPAHIYHPKASLTQAYRDVFDHMRLVYEIGMANHQEGIPFAPTFEFLHALRDHLWEAEAAIEEVVPALPEYESI